MGRTVKATIVFGISVYREDWENIPWYDAEDEDLSDEDDWWREINGYEPSFDPWEVEKSPSRESKDRYFKEQREWDMNHLIPVEMLFFGGEEENGVLITCPRYPRYKVDFGSFSVNFDPEQLKIEPDKAFEDFAAKYFPESKIGWNLILWCP